MRVAILTEVVEGERRVAATPETVRRFVRAGLKVAIQAGAGAAAGVADEDYTKAGAEIGADPAELLGAADVVLRLHPPTDHPAAGRHEAELLKAGAVWISVIRPGDNKDAVQRLADAKTTSFALEFIPRITRAQSMDVLSSQATVAGYKAVLLAADALGKMMPMLMTAAGTIRPATVLIIGAGVAGLQAIATARRLGANVKAVDTRPAVAEQVGSLGAKFVPLEVDHSAEDAGGYATDLGEEFYAGEQAIIAPYAQEADIIITTAQIPGRLAPRLIPEATVETMRPGSVIVDLAAATGGNCSLTEPGRTVEKHGVKILAPLNLPAEIPVHASEMFARNVATFLDELLDEGKLKIDLENEVIRETLITRDGEIVYEATRAALDSPADADGATDSA